MMLDRIEVNSHEPVARRVFRELRNAIVTMGIRPGQALSEQEIATRLGVSRQPVREAFIKLSEAGLLTIRPQRGTFIVKISMKQVFDARFVREAVELAVVRRACAEMTVSGMEALRTNLDAQRKAATDLDPVRPWHWLRIRVAGSRGNQGADGPRPLPEPSPCNPGGAADRPASGGGGCDRGA
jgi:GntR family transcriptional regulator, rspAB operon transcriptional repressor